MASQDDVEASECPVLRKSEFPRQHLPVILLIICVSHLVLKTLMLEHQYNRVSENETNTHFGLTCVLALILCLLISSTIVDMIFRMHYTFRYVIGLNIALFGSLLFVTGYLFGHLGEILYASLSANPANPASSCRSLGINVNPNVTYQDTNNTVPSSSIVGGRLSVSCHDAIYLEYYNVAVDLLLILCFLPLHISATAFSWTFSGLFRPRNPEEFNS